MKFPYAMLRDYVETQLTAEEAGELLTMAGFELEGIEGEVLDIKVCSNRGDGLSMLGLAREVLAKDTTSKPTDLYISATQRLGNRGDNDQSTVEIQTEDCSRYAAFIFEGVQNSDAPKWIQERLEQAGMRPISLIVDLTNYVLLELGQPMHAFDLDKLAGGRIVIRQATSGEPFVTLDGVKHELHPNQMMICDARGPVAVAGVMGGLESEVSETTTRVLLEVAHFKNTSVRKTRKQLGLSTEASYRFERSVDPEGVLGAGLRFGELLGVAPVRIVDAYPQPALPRTVTVRMSRTNRLLGMEISTAEARGYLERLGFQVSGSGEPFELVVPTWRPDVEREDDVIEDIGRVHGFNRIPESLPAGSTPQGGVFGVELLIDKLREAMIRCGFSQCISHSLRDSHALDNSGERIGPRNPASPEMALLRNSLLPSLADAGRRNGGRDLHLFEMGAVFEPAETRRMAALTNGALSEPYWKADDKSQADFFSLKGSLISAVSQLSGKWSLEFVPSSNDPRLHPTQQSELTLNGKNVGVIGTLHPDRAEAAGLQPGTAVLEINLDRLLPEFLEDSSGYHPISRNPSVRRDIAILIPKSVPYSTIQETIQSAGGGVLEKQWLFDVYAGSGIPEGSHSLAIAMQFRKPGQNFTDEEANQVRDQIVAELAGLGATLR